MSKRGLASSTGPIGIVAGAGRLPGIVADAVIAGGRDAFVVALHGFAEKGVKTHPHIEARFSEVTRIIRKLHAENIKDLVLVGSLSRPSGFGYLRDVGIDVLWRALINIDLFRSGDSTMLQRVLEALEREGFNILGAHEVAPELVMPPANLGNIKPGRDDEADISRGFEAAIGLGALDIGQGVVVSRRRVLAAEAAEGTDRMLARVSEIRSSENADGLIGEPRGVLVKCPQPIQDLRVDMPTIGPDTVRGASVAGLKGIAIAAHKVLVLEPEAVRRLADERGLFVTARDLGDFDTVAPKR